MPGDRAAPDLRPLQQRIAAAKDRQDPRPGPVLTSWLLGLLRMGRR